MEERGGSYPKMVVQGCLDREIDRKEDLLPEPYNEKRQIQLAQTNN